LGLGVAPGREGIMKILVAIGSAAASDVFLERLTAQFRSSDAQIKVIHVVQPLAMSVPPQMSRDFSPELKSQIIEAGEAIKNAAKKLSNSGFQADSSVLKGDVRDSIVDVAMDWHADLILVGAHERKGIRRLALGGVAEYVARHAPCSVEIVRMPRESREAGPLRILLAIDDSKYSNAAEQMLIDSIPPSKAEVCVLHAVEPPYLIPYYYVGTQQEIEAAHGKALKLGQELARRAEERLEEAGFKVCSHVEEGDPRTSILDHAGEWNAELVLVGSQGRTGLDRLLMGSVAEAVARHAPCSVWIVRNPAIHSKQRPSETEAHEFSENVSGTSAMDKSEQGLWSKFSKPAYYVPRPTNQGEYAQVLAAFTGPCCAMQSHGTGECAVLMWHTFRARAGLHCLRSQPKAATHFAMPGIWGFVRPARL